MHKKGMAGLVVIIVVVLVLVFLGWLSKEAWKECRYDSHCQSDEYCGSDFSCHEKEKVIIEKASPADTTKTGWIIGISLIIAALIFKWDSLFGKKRHTSEKEETPEEVQKRLRFSYDAEPDGQTPDAIREEY